MKISKENQKHSHVWSAPKVTIIRRRQACRPESALSVKSGIHGHSR